MERHADCYYLEVVDNTAKRSQRRHRRRRHKYCLKTTVPLPQIVKSRDTLAGCIAVEGAPPSHQNALSRGSGGLKEVQVGRVGTIVRPPCACLFRVATVPPPLCSPSCSVWSPSGRCLRKGGDPSKSSAHQGDDELYIYIYIYQGFHSNHAQTARFNIPTLLHRCNNHEFVVHVWALQ